jgi:hypothetical protein
MKRIAIIVRTADPDRLSEALRAAVGLGLRGDRVHVVLGALPAPDTPAARALATLRMLGHAVDSIEAGAAGDSIEAGAAGAVRAADAIEVWT